MNTRGALFPLYITVTDPLIQEKRIIGEPSGSLFCWTINKKEMKNGQSEEPRKGRRFREKEDGEMIRKYFAKMPTKELARMLGLEPRKVSDFAHRNNFEGCLKKNKAERKQVARENGKKGGRPRKKS